MSMGCRVYGKYRIKEVKQKKNNSTPFNFHVPHGTIIMIAIFHKSKEA